MHVRFSRVFKRAFSFSQDYYKKTFKDELILSFNGVLLLQFQKNDLRHLVLRYVCAHMNRRADILNCYLQPTKIMKLSSLRV